VATGPGKRKPERRPLAERVADSAFEESPLPTYPTFVREDGTVVTNEMLQERDRRLFPRARRRDDD